MPSRRHILAAGCALAAGSAWSQETVRIGTVAAADPDPYPYLALDLRCALLFFLSLEDPRDAMRTNVRKMLAERYTVSNRAVGIVGEIAAEVNKLIPIPNDLGDLQGNELLDRQWSQRVHRATPEHLRFTGELIDRRRAELRPQDQLVLSRIISGEYHRAYRFGRSGVPSHVPHALLPQSGPLQLKIEGDLVSVRIASRHPVFDLVELLRQMYGWNLHVDVTEESGEALEVTWQEKPEHFLGEPDATVLAPVLEQRGLRAALLQSGGLRVFSPGSPLEVLVSVNAEERRLYDLLESIREQISVERRVRQGPASLTELMSMRGSIEAQRVPAYVLLDRILVGIKSDLSWDLQPRKDGPEFSLGLRRLFLKFRDPWLGKTQEYSARSLRSIGQRGPA